MILGYPKVGPAIDLWSLACIVFELITGDFLFDPKAEKTLDKDVYHLVLFMQVLGCAPRTLPTPPSSPPWPRGNRGISRCTFVSRGLRFGLFGLSNENCLPKVNLVIPLSPQSRPREYAFHFRMILPHFFPLFCDQAAV